MVSFGKSWPNLSAGELDAGLAAREDLSFYDKGLKSARNVLCLPTGGFRDRGGLVHVDYVRGQLEAIDIPPGSVTTPSGSVEIIEDPNGEPIIIVTDPVVPNGGGYIVRVDFGAPVEVHLVDAIDFEVEGAAAADAWRVEYSHDASTWTAFGNTFDADGKQSRRAGLGPRQSITARYWRVFGTVAIEGREFAAAELRFWRETDELSNVKAFGFAYDTTATYLMVHTDRNIEVYDARERRASIPAPHRHADIAIVNRAQSLDTLLQFHSDYAPWRVFRYSDAGNWDAREQAFENVPREQFDGTSYTNGKNEKQEVLTLNMTDGSDRFTLSYAGKVSPGITYAGNDADTANNIATALAAIEDIGAGNVTVTKTDNNTFTVEFVGDLAQQEHPVLGYQFLGPGDGDEILQVSRVQEGEKGGEDIFSAARGYPSCGTFYQSRLLMGGMRSRPATVLFSVLGDYFNFDIELTGDGALSLAIDDDQIKRIRHIYPGRSLGIFTDDAEFWVTDRVIVKGEPISFAKGTRRGVKIGLDVLEADDQTLFVQADGGAVRAFSYAEGLQSFVAPSLSRLAPHLVKDPGDWTVRRGASARGAELVFLANSDGSAGVCALMADEEFLAWHNWDTDGKFMSFGTEGADEVYAVIERTAGGVTTRRLEAYDETSLYDAAVIRALDPAIDVAAGSRARITWRARRSSCGWMAVRGDPQRSRTAR
ncbi:MAG: hypothetical protein ABJQ26_08530 [Maricaulis sp.]|uniref:hypothetical protein n=1 Tax=Maricaulis sp. TaxID=1486257 RepID=UPI003297BA6F